MAWLRTAMALVAVGVLVARQSGSVAAGAVILVAVVLVAGSMLAEAEHRHHVRRPGRGAGDVAGVLRHVAATATAATALAVCSAVIVLS